MQDVFVILLMILGAATGVLSQDPVVCRFTESNQCYVALGQQLHLQMPQEDGFNLIIRDKTNTTHLILKYRKAQSNPSTPTLPRWQFVNDNKTMILTSAERSDSGTYTLETFDANGKTKGNYNLQVIIKEDFTLAILSTVCVLLILLFVISFYIYKRRQGLRKKEAAAQDRKALAQVTTLPANSTETRPSTSPDQAEDEGIQYVTVTTSPSQGNQKKADEVQYGELVFNTPAPQKSEMPKLQEECVYAQVQHGQ